MLDVYILTRCYDVAPRHDGKSGFSIQSRWCRHPCRSPWSRPTHVRGYPLEIPATHRIPTAVERLQANIGLFLNVWCALCQDTKIRFQILEQCHWTKGERSDAPSTIVFASIWFSTTWPQQCDDRSMESCLCWPDNMRMVFFPSLWGNHRL